MKTQLQEAKRIEEVIREQLNEKKKDCEKLEDEIILLRKKLEKGTIQSRLENNSKILDDILNSQRPSSNKTRFTFDQKKTNEGSNPIIHKN